MILYGLNCLAHPDLLTNVREDNFIVVCSWQTFCSTVEMWNNKADTNTAVLVQFCFGAQFKCLGCFEVFIFKKEEQCLFEH